MSPDQEDVERRNPNGQPLATGGVQRLITGAVGLTKAALHVDRAPEVVARRRRGICAGCPQATAGLSKTSRCKVCTCFIYPKTATATEACPLRLWCSP